MLFNSLEFAIFLPVVFFVYWFVMNKNIKMQNSLIVIASYLFYGWWDWRFLFLIIISTIVDYFVALALHSHKKIIVRKLLLIISISVNLGILGFFKYFNFFLLNFNKVFTFFGIMLNTDLLNILLPVGISFYTFQTLSYTIDVYREKLKPTRDFIAFSAYVSFFPQLVAGPIERASNLLPQFYIKRKFNYSKSIDGLRQILWGLFKKIVIADNCAVYANMIFNNSSDYSGSTLVLGVFFFTFQIYGDFSGYSDIAIGTSRLFGFNLMKNFAYPYFSRDVSEFWRKWHISLSTWFRDYLYIPLGGSNVSTLCKIRNTFIIFIVSGFWHGANWTFIAWGILNAIYILPLLILKKNKNNLDVVAKNKTSPSLSEISNMIITFCLTMFAWIFFRSSSLSHAFSYISKIFSKSFFTIPNFSSRRHALVIVFYIIILLLFEWKGREDEYAIEKFILHKSRKVRWSFYYLLIFVIILLVGPNQQFIYFQF